MAGKRKGPIKAVAKKTEKETSDALNKSSEIKEYVYNIIILHYH